MNQLTIHIIGFEPIWLQAFRDFLYGPFGILKMLSPKWNSKMFKGCQTFWMLNFWVHFEASQEWKFEVGGLDSAFLSLLEKTLPQKMENRVLLCYTKW